MSGVKPMEDVSLHEAGKPHERTPLIAKNVKSKGCCHSVFGSSMVAECLTGDGRRPSLPEPKRRDVPLSHNQYELQECFPCVYKPLHYFLLDRLPFLRWLLRYNVRWLVADVVAGLTVGLMVVPQALAYAKIANLRLKYGLYTAFMGCFIYTLFGTSKDITLGPTAILSLLTATLTESCNPNPTAPYCDDCVPCALTLTLFTGLVQLVLGLLSLGFLVDFIPLPIISGFTSAAAITIAVGQIHSLLGLSHNVRRRFYLTIYDLFHYITEVKAGDIVFGCLCISLVVFLKYFKVHIESVKEKKREHHEQTMTGKAAFKFLWLFCTARNAVVVMIGALVGYTLTTQSWFDGQLSLILDEEFSLPQPQPPNITTQSIKEIGIGIAVAPFISFLESIAIAKAFARKDGYKVEPSQELVAIGIANVVSSFFSSYPVTGSFSRTAVNNQSGVRTPAAGIITGTVVLLAIALLSQFFHYIPKAALSAIIIAAVLPMVDIRIFYKIFKIKVLDDVPLVVAFLFTLILGIEVQYL
jgi:sodium-independent sulfate anion transporter 11